MRPLEFVQVCCPYCGGAWELSIDCSAGRQEYIQDCEGCCRPMIVSVNMDEEGKIQVDVRSEDE
ncbi:MAG: CPXCG motif-containing cysteine-rich protein [Candidatus Hydrogenedentes bacterium]|nr:CPXCG motif-containing cysteine-rich protein [Candidatus Hydrogenedentota bacterium]